MQQLPTLRAILQMMTSKPELFYDIATGATQALLQGDRYEDPPQSLASLKQLMQ